MKLILQRAKKGSVNIDNNQVAKIEKGLVVLVGICDLDDEKVLDYMAQKIINLRIFEDDYGKMNLSLKDIRGELLLVSQFTLYADCKKGRRPSFAKAGNPEFANKMYEKFIEICKIYLENKVECGVFGADMQVELINDGPVTIILDSDEIM